LPAGSRHGARSLQYQVHQADDLGGVLDSEWLGHEVTVRGLVTSEADLSSDVVQRLGDVAVLIEPLDLDFRSPLVIPWSFATASITARATATAPAGGPRASG
jgi:hypothetical protein